MQLPVDVGKLIGETTNIKEAREMPVSLSVYIDGSAPAELIAHVRNVFASSSPHVSMTVTYLDKSFIPYPTDDLAVIVAGDSPMIGHYAEAIRAVGVPVMVVTTSPVKVDATAAAQGTAIPDGDVVSPVAFSAEDGVAGGAAVEGAAAEGAAAEGAFEEPIEFTDEAASRLNERMGAWIAFVCYNKRLSLAVAFPFMRRALARESVTVTSAENALIGLIPFIPGADLPLMTLNQAKMALQIAAAYGCEMSMERLKELAIVIGGAYLGRAIARELVEFIPFLGFAIRTGVAYGTTAAMGFAVIEYFEGGENATGVANVATKASEAGVRALAKARDIAADPSSVSSDRANEVADIVREKAGEYLPQVIGVVEQYGPQLVEKANEYAPKLKAVAASALAKVIR